MEYLASLEISNNLREVLAMGVFVSVSALIVYNKLGSDIGRAYRSAREFFNNQSRLESKKGLEKAGIEDIF